MPCVVGGFVQHGSTCEADHEDDENSEDQRSHRAGYLAPQTVNRLFGPNRSGVHCRSLGVFLVA